MSRQLIYQRKRTYLTTQGYVIKVIMKLFKSTDKSLLEFPEGYKFNWIAYNEDNPEEKVLFDNHHGKKPHWHVNGQEEFFPWYSQEKSEQLFFQKIEARFGYLKTEITPNYDN